MLHIWNKQYIRPMSRPEDYPMARVTSEIFASTQWTACVALFICWVGDSFKLEAKGACFRMPRFCLYHRF